MKKKGTIGLVATLGLGLCAYALSQQAPVKEDKKSQNQVQYLQGDKKKSASNSNKQEESIESVNSKEKTQAEQIVVKISDEGFVTSHGDHHIPYKTAADNSRSSQRRRHSQSCPDSHESQADGWQQCPGLSRKKRCKRCNQKCHKKKYVWIQ